jgi:hypothetical protein
MIAAQALSVNVSGLLKFEGFKVVDAAAGTFQLILRFWSVMLHDQVLEPGHLPRGKQVREIYYPGSGTGKTCHTL